MGIDRKQQNQQRVHKILKVASLTSGKRWLMIRKNAEKGEDFSAQNEREAQDSMKRLWKVCLAAWLLILGSVMGGALLEPLQVQAAQTEKIQVQFQYTRRKEFRLSAGQIRQGDTGKVTLKGKTVTDVRWTSSKPSIVTVDDTGKVTAKHTGTAVLTAKYTWKKRAYRYRVNIQVVSRLAAEQKKFPTGTYWNDGGDNNQVTQRPCIHDGDRYCAYNSVGCESNLYIGMVAGMQVAGYQCHGFALKVAQDLYGSLKNWKYVESYRTIHAGDVIRINNNTHTIIVTKVYSGSIQYADCNSTGDCQIQWGKTMSKQALRKAFTYMYTKY